MIDERMVTAEKYHHLRGITLDLCEALLLAYPGHLCVGTPETRLDNADRGCLFCTAAVIFEAYAAGVQVGRSGETSRGGEAKSPRVAKRPMLRVVK